MTKCAVIGKGKVVNTVCKCLRELGEYKPIYCVKDGAKNLEKECNGIEFITYEELMTEDAVKTMKIIIADDVQEQLYKRVLESGYSKDNIIFADDIIKEMFHKEYEAFCHKYECIGENIEITVNDKKITEDLIKYGFDVIKYHVDKNDYQYYLDQANYEEQYPAYLNEFKEGLSAKTFQHYISYKLLDMKKDDVYMDVASSNSVFPYIAEKLCGIKAYKQDISYKWGVNGNLIGSYASSIPMPDNTVDYMTLHCSFEHFEGKEDFDFIKESHRLLAERGKICIIPLYLADEFVIMTSPKVWLNKYSVYIKAPELDPRAKISINETICQRQSKHFSAKILKDELLNKFKDQFNIKIYYMENFREFERAKPFALILEKI